MKNIIPKKFEAKHIHKGRFSGPHKTHCALGWIYQLEERYFHKTRQILIDRHPLVVDWNDNPNTTKEEIAKELNIVFDYAKVER